MVDQRAKGRTGEYKARDLLREWTGYKWERAPASGALPYLKGDLYIPPDDSNFCVEVKNYKESAITDKVLTAKTNNLVMWWNKLEIQAASNDKIPLLLCRYNRSKWFVGTNIQPVNTKNFIHMGNLGCFILLAEEWLDKEKVNWIRNRNG